MTWKQQINIIFFGDRWDDMWRRRQQFAYRFARMPGVEEVIYVELPVSATSFLKFLGGKADVDAAVKWRRIVKRGFCSSVDGIQIVTPISILPSFRYNKLSHFNDRLLGWLTRLLVENRPSGKKIDSSCCILWLSHPFGGDFVGKFGESLVCYDCTEKFAQYEEWDPKFLREINMRDEAIASRADLVFTQTELHCKEKCNLNPNTYLLPNAVDYDLFAENVDKLDLSKLGISTRPVLGFVGNVNWRTDYKLLFDLAKAHPEWTLVFVGTLRGERFIQILRRLPNVRFLGPRPYRELPRLIRAFDVCLIPYRKLAIENSPIKLLDYLASGRPIVATRIPGVENFADVVYVADNSEDFCEKVEQALGEAPRFAERRLARARENSWDVRVKEAWDLILGKLDLARSSNG